VGTFVAFRTLGDACLAWMQGFVKRRDLPPGFARFLSRRSKQSVESLEAEFDAKIASDLDFSKSPDARLAFFYQRSPWYDTQHVGDYPIVRLDAAGVASVRAAR
jgi:hypothetical protein